jgi:putative peptidoglycan lipid II flippase
MSLVALAGGLLNSWSRFALPAFTPVLLNISFIAMALFAAPYFDPPVLALAWAVFIGGLLQMAIQIPALKKSPCCRARPSTGAPPGPTRASAASPP